jgi:lipopolysaccharide transport protein LptA
MKKPAASILAIALIAAAQLPGQTAVSPSESPSANAKKPKKDTTGKTATNKLLGSGKATSEPVTTEIYADEAVFDSNKSMGIFSGHVKVADPRFNLQSEKLTVFIRKGEGQGLEKAVAEGNVALVRDRPDPNGGPPTRAVGRSEKATYLATSGDVELTGTPRVQEGPNTHVATSPDTVMIVNQNGQLTTHGPSRTEIRQMPKTEEGEKKAEASPSPKL